MRLSQKAANKKATLPSQSRMRKTLDKVAWVKRIKLVIHQPAINKLIGNELSLLLNENADTIDAIKEADKIIETKGRFPVESYGSLLHMIYNPAENRFYKQAAITAFTQSSEMLNARDNPKKELPDGTTIIIIPAGGCITEWEEAMDYEEFLKAAKD